MGIRLLLLCACVSLSANAAVAEETKPLWLDGTLLSEHARVEKSGVFLPVSALGRAVGYPDVACERRLGRLECHDSSQKFLIIVSPHGPAWYQPAHSQPDDVVDLPLPGLPPMTAHELWLDPKTIARVMNVDVRVREDGVRVTTRSGGRDGTHQERPVTPVATDDDQVDAPETEALPDDEEKPDELAATDDIQVDAPEIQELAKRLTRDAKTPLAKVKAIHDWLTTNVRYDYDGLADFSEAVIDAVGVLKQKSGICEGYSNLAAALFRASGFPARVIHGWARDNNETWLDVLKADPVDENHSWNEVLVGDRWVTIDVTWDAGFDHRGRKTRPSTRYFDPPAERFANDHLTKVPSKPPANPAWFQLREHDAREVSSLANKEVLSRVGKYKRGCVISFRQKPVGHFEGSGAQALVIGTRKGCTLSGSLLLRFAAREKSWVLVEAKDVAGDEELPSGEWPAPTLSSGDTTRAKNRTPALE